MTAWDAMGEGVLNPEQHNAWPLPPMDEMPDEVDMPMEFVPFATQADEDAFVAFAKPLWERYAAHRRAHAEATGRPYPETRHAVWPR